ncbi:hypothetical protein GVAV_002585 [Gurleya vavrai]
MKYKIYIIPALIVFVLLIIFTVFYMRKTKSIEEVVCILKNTDDSINYDQVEGILDNTNDETYTDDKNKIDETKLNIEEKYDSIYKQALKYAETFKNYTKFVQLWNEFTGKINRV